MALAAPPHKIAVPKIGLNKGLETELLIDGLKKCGIDMDRELAEGVRKAVHALSGDGVHAIAQRVLPLAERLEGRTQKRRFMIAFTNAATNIGNDCSAIGSAMEEIAPHCRSEEWSEITLRAISRHKHAGSL